MRKVIFMLVVTLAGIFAAFATDKNLTLDELFDKVSHIDRFEVMDFNGGNMGFPDNLGKGVLAIHPNAEPREEIVACPKGKPITVTVFMPVSFRY